MNKQDFYREQKYSIRLSGGPHDGSIFRDLIGDIKIPNYVDNGQVAASGFKVFDYRPGANLP